MIAAGIAIGLCVGGIACAVVGLYSIAVLCLTGSCIAAAVSTIFEVNDGPNRPRR